jgi:RNA polymerase sigma-70 factor (ECF subfamily)
MEQPGPDSDTLQRVADGDAAAFRSLVEHWQGRVFGFCWRMTADRALSEDLAQEVFLKVYQVFHRYDRTRPFAPWMRRVMVNEVLNRLRGERRDLAPLDAAPEGASSFADVRAPDPVLGASREEEAAIVRRCVEALPPAWRAVVALRYQEELPVQDIAAILDLPVNTVKTRLFRAREALRADLRSMSEDRP